MWTAIFFLDPGSLFFFLWKHRITIYRRWSIISTLIEVYLPWVLFWYLFIFMYDRGAIQIVDCTYWSSSDFIPSCRTHQATTKRSLCFRTICRCSHWTEQARNGSELSGSCNSSCLWCSCCSAWGGSFAYQCRWIQDQIWRGHNSKAAFKQHDISSSSSYRHVIFQWRWGEWPQWAPNGGYQSQLPWSELWRNEAPGRAIRVWNWSW